jgi:beta-galactosidase
MPVRRPWPNNGPPSVNDSHWTLYSNGTSGFDKTYRFSWFQTVLSDIDPAVAVKLISFKCAGKFYIAYINGQMSAMHRNNNPPVQANISRMWNSNGSNILSILTENSADPGEAARGVSLTTYKNSTSVDDWALRGGPGDPNSTKGWTPLENGSAFHGPQFFKTSFTANPPGASGSKPALRVTTEGLSHGSIWVNGHNLGRYPQIIPAPGLYIPECWLKSGSDANTLVIFDENGNRPDNARVAIERDACRDSMEYRGKIVE